MASDVGSVPPPPFAVVFVRTSLDTSLALDVLPSDSVSDLKVKMRAYHLKTFPSHGEIVVHSLKFQHRGQFYCLSDSFLLRAIVNQRGGGHLLLSAEVSASEPHLQRPAPLTRGQASVGGGNKYPSPAIGGGSEENNLDNHPSGLEMSSAPLHGSHGRDSDAPKCPILDKKNSLGTTPAVVEGTCSIEPYERVVIGSMGVDDVSAKSLPKRTKERAPRKDSINKQDLKGTKHVSFAPNSLPEVEDPIGKEKMIGDTAMIMDEEVLDEDVGNKTGAHTIQNNAIQGDEIGDVSQDQMVPGDSEDAKRDNAVKVTDDGIKNSSKGKRVEELPKNALYTAEEVMVDSVGDKLLSKKRKKLASKADSSRKRDPVVRSAETKEPITTLLHGQVVNADAGSKSGPQKRAETGEQVDGACIAAAVGGDKSSERKTKESTRKDKSSSMKVADQEQGSKKKRIVAVGLRASTMDIATQTDTSKVIKENTLRKEVKVEKRKQRPSTLDQPSVAATNSTELNSPASSTRGATNLSAEPGKHPEQQNIITRSRSVVVTSPSQKDEKGNGRKSTNIPARK